MKEILRLAEVLVIILKGPVTSTGLKDISVYVFQLYAAIVLAAHNNTAVDFDFEELAITRDLFTRFKLKLLPGEVLETLGPMTGNGDYGGHYTKFKYSKRNNITYAVVPWLDASDSEDASGLMGYITIEPGRLILDADTEELIEMGSSRLTELLGDKITPAE